MEDDENSASSLITILLGLIFILAGFCAVAIFSWTNDLACTRVEPSLIRCTSQAKLFGLYQLSERTFTNISGAAIGESCDEDGCACRVELQTEAGIIPLNQVYVGGIGGCNTQRDKANKINAFLADGTAVTVTIPETLSEKLITFMPLSFVLIGAVMLVKGVRTFMISQ